MVYDHMHAANNEDSHFAVKRFTIFRLFILLNEIKNTAGSALSIKQRSGDSSMTTRRWLVALGEIWGIKKERSLRAQ